MLIDSIRLLHVAQPVAVAEPFGDRQLDRHESVLVELGSGQHSAWGQADPGTAPGDSAEWAAGAMLCLKDWLAPEIVGQDLTSGEALQQRLRHVVGNSAGKAALDIAWWNLEAARQSRSLAELLGADKTTLPAGVVLNARESIDDLLAEIGTAVARGYASIGLKFRPGQGVEMVRAVRAVFPTTALWIDCDGLCRLEQRETFFRLDDFLLQRIEQPLAADDLVGHAMLQEGIRTPIALDQSITSLERVEQALELGSCRQVRIDPERVGGVTPALAIAAVCAEKGATVLAGVATTDFSFNIARSLALSPRFAGVIDVGGPALSVVPAGELGQHPFPPAGGAANPGRLPGEIQQEHILDEFVVKG